MLVNKVGGQDALLVSREVSHMVTCHFLQNSAFICPCVSNTPAVVSNMLVTLLVLSPIVKQLEPHRCMQKDLKDSQL